LLNIQRASGEGQPADHGKDGHWAFLDREPDGGEELVRAIQRFLGEFTRLIHSLVRHAIRLIRLVTATPYWVAVLLMLGS